MDPDVVRAVLADEPACPIDSVHTWYGGRYRSMSDVGLIALAAREGLTLVTRDVGTIPQLLNHLFETGQPHGGVVFVTERAFPRRDIGRVARALVQLWQASHDIDWQGRYVYLRASG